MERWPLQHHGHFIQASVYWKLYPIINTYSQPLTALSLTHQIRMKYIVVACMVVMSLELDGSGDRWVDGGVTEGRTAGICYVD